MIPAFMGGVLPGPAHVFPVDSLFDDLSRQIAISQSSRRSSRGAVPQRNGNPLRVAKPTSANSSPSRPPTAMQARRRTVVNDGNLARRRRQQPIDLAAVSDYASQSRPTRPISWNPSTLPHQHLHHQYQQLPLQPKVHAAQPMLSYPYHPTPSPYDSESSYPVYHQFPPTPAAYSCGTSPVASLSPLSMPLGTYHASTYLPVDCFEMTRPEQPAYLTTSDPVAYTEPFPPLPASVPDLTSPASCTAWQSYPTDRFTGTAPPTPETLPPAQQPQPMVPNEDTIPFHPLDDSEDDGEVLVGMGLYDAPDKYDQDPQLHASRSAMSSLLGAPYRPLEGTGKGLKLEESWQPPESDEEDEDDDEEEDDADGEDSDD